METVGITLTCLAMFAIFMALGFFFQRKNLLPKDTATALSNLEVYVFTPAIVLNTFTKNCTVQNLSKNWNYVMWGFAVVGLGLVISYIAAHFFDKGHGTLYDIVAYSVAMPNFGYIGYPLIGAVLGDDALFRMMIFAIPYNIAVYSIGLYQLNPDKRLNFKTFLNPAVVAMVLGALIGLLQIPVPSFFQKIFQNGADCMAPLAMMLTGMILARHPLIKTFTNAKLYLLTFLRNIFVPALSCALLYYCGIRGELLLIASITAALPMGMNPVIYIEAYGGDPSEAVQANLISNLLAIITVPLGFYLISTLAGL